MELDVKKDITQEELEKHYHQMSLDIHPDKCYKCTVDERDCYRLVRMETSNAYNIIENILDFEEWVKTVQEL